MVQVKMWSIWRTKRFLRRKQLNDGQQKRSGDARKRNERRRTRKGRGKLEQQYVAPEEEVEEEA